jgi:hypothetical protein
MLTSAGAPSCEATARFYARTLEKAGRTSTAAATLLASAGGRLDQSTTSRKHHPSDYVGDGRLIRGRGVIFPGSHRTDGASHVKDQQ